MKRTRKLLSILLTLCVLFTSVSMDAFALPKSEGETVTRAEWIEALADAFGMSVDDDNYVDNYYSDLNSDSPYYHTVMLATEFGLVDIEAGGEFKPEEPATRAFAAHTFNKCMGYVTQSEKFTFAEAETVEYPEDIQVAIEQGWLSLTGNAFLPDESITAVQKEAFLAIAKTEMDARKINENYKSTYHFVSDVIVLDENLNGALTDENEITFYDKVSLNVGDKFGIVKDGFPIVKKVAAIEAGEEQTIITTEEVDTDEAFTEMDMEGSLEGNLAQIQPIGEDVVMQYLVGGTEEANWEDSQVIEKSEVSAQELEKKSGEFNAVRITKTYAIPENVRRSFNLEAGVSAYIECTISQVSVDYSFKQDGESYFVLNAKVSFNCNVSMDVLKALNVDNSIQLAYVPVAYIGYMKATLELQLEGDINLNITERLSVGMRYHKNSGFSLISQLQKESFSLVARVQAKAGISLSVGVNVCVLKASLYGKMGVQGIAQFSAYPDDSKTCLHINAWMYASLGCNASLDFPGKIFDKSWDKSINIYNQKNSPFKISFHYENGKPITRCTKEGCHTTDGRIQKVTYYTPANSRYGYNGASWGLDDAGREFTIFNYEQLSDGSGIRITSYNGNVSALTIPSELDGYSVKEIGSNVFKGRKELVSVTIPNTVTIIQASAFENCANLRSIRIPDSVTDIGRYAFSTCPKLKDVKLSYGLTQIGEYAFSDCISLTEIEIPKSLVNVSLQPWGIDPIPKSPFYHCSNLKSVHFEKGCTVIIGGLFYGCDGLEQIELPDTITEIRLGAFANCENLAKITIPDSITDIGRYAFSNCSKLKDIKLSYGLTKIGEYAFSNCTSLTEIEIPKSLVDVYALFEGTKIPKSPFYHCSNLKSVHFEKGCTVIADGLLNGCDGLEQIEIPDTITEIHAGALSNCENLVKITIPDSISIIQASTFENCTSLQSIQIPDSVTEIGLNAFLNCSKLREVKLSYGLTKIGQYAFSDCTSLTEIEIPKSLVDVLDRYGGTFYVPISPFYHCSNLKSIRFEEGCTVIGAGLFNDCNGLEQIEIPNTVTTIEHSAFKNCTNLTRVILHDGKLKEIGNDAFSGCTSLPEITIPNSVTGMGTYTFSGCTSLKKAVLPNTRQNLMEGTFQDCTSLTDITLPDSLTAIRKNAFKNCDSLTGITIPKNVTVIEDSAFEDCDALITAVLSDSVTSIGRYCFKSCDMISKITLGTSLTAIPSQAFMDCGSLEELVLPYCVTFIGAEAFKNDTSLIRITIPRSVTSIDSTAFSYPKKLTISGVAGSYANTFATEKGIAFNPIDVPASSLTISKTSLILYQNKTTDLYAIVKPLDYTGNIVWSSSNPEIVSVTGNGRITAHKYGTAKITATVGEKTASCEVTVPVPVSSIKLDSTSLTISLGSPYQLKPVIEPENAFNKKLLYTSSDESIATVDEAGLVTPHKAGSVRITIQSEDGYASRTCYITVTSTQEDTSSFRLGDVDHDGKVAVADALAILMHLADKNSSGYHADTADCDASGKVAVADALDILMYLADKPSKIAAYWPK